MNLDKSKKNFTPHLILAVALTLAIFQLYTAGVSMLTAWISAIFTSS